MLKRFLGCTRSSVFIPAPSKETPKESLGFQMQLMPCRPHRILNTHSPSSGSLHPRTHWNCSVFKVLPDKSSPYARDSTKVPFKDPSGELCFYSLSVLLSPILGHLLEPRFLLHFGLVPFDHQIMLLQLETASRMSIKTGSLVVFLLTDQTLLTPSSIVPEQISDSKCRLFSCHGGCHRFTNH